MESTTNPVTQQPGAKLFSAGHLLAYLTSLTDTRKRRGISALFPTCEPLPDS